MLAHFDELDLAEQRGEVNTEPPVIYFSSTPAALQIFLGEPRFKPIEGTTLMFAVNTNWDVILEPASSTYHIRNGSEWFTTRDITKGSYEAARALPDEFARQDLDRQREASEKGNSRSSSFTSDRSRGTSRSRGSRGGRR